MITVLQFPEKKSCGAVFANCPVKKKIKLWSSIAVPVVVTPPVIPVMDARQSIFACLRTMKEEEYEQFAPLCNSKCSSSKPVEMLGQEPDFISAPVLLAFKVIHEDVLKQLESMSVVTHVATGTVRESPLHKSTGKEGDSHFLAYPAGATVKKAKKAFLGQKNNFIKGTFAVDRNPRNEHLFPVDKGWSEVTCKTPEGTVTPLQIFVMEISKEQDQVFRYTTERHSLQFQSTINTIPCRILLDTGATGMAFFDREHCVKEGIVLGPTPAKQNIVMADGSKTKCTNMATIKLRLGRYESQVECIVIDHLEDYPLVLGNP
jgi:hypothetical protein